MANRLKPCTLLVFLEIFILLTLFDKKVYLQKHVLHPTDTVAFFAVDCGGYLLLRNSIVGKQGVRMIYSSVIENENKFSQNDRKRSHPQTREILSCVTNLIDYRDSILAKNFIPRPHQELRQLF